MVNDFTRRMSCVRATRAFNRTNGCGSTSKHTRYGTIRSSFLSSSTCTPSAINSSIDLNFDVGYRQLPTTEHIKAMNNSAEDALVIIYVHPTLLVKVGIEATVLALGMLVESGRRLLETLSNPRVRMELRISFVLLKFRIFPMVSKSKNILSIFASASAINGVSLGFPERNT
jgi:hypothetical protein